MTSPEVLGKNFRRQPQFCMHFKQSDSVQNTKRKTIWLGVVAVRLGKYCFYDYFLPSFWIQMKTKEQIFVRRLWVGTWLFFVLFIVKFGLHIFLDFYFCFIQTNFIIQE